MSDSAYLGIFGPGPNASAAIVTRNRIVAWAEEERFNRIKTSPHNFPAQAISFCLDQARADGLQIKAVGYGWDCEDYARMATENLESTLKQYPSSSDALSRKAQQRLNQIYDPEVILNTLRIALDKSGIDLRKVAFRFFKHHLCHAASVHHVSGFADSIVVVNDGVGEVASSTLYHASNGAGFRELAHVNLPDTLGGFYASITEFLGFKAYMDEGKTMGLAAYGSEDSVIRTFFDEFVSSGDVGFSYTTNPRFRYQGDRSFGVRFTDELVARLGPPRRGGSAITSPYPEIAYAAQKKLEDVLFDQISYAAGLGLSRNICFAGGVHMNCKANGAIAESPAFENYFFQPAASDNGIPLGAAILAATEIGGEKAAFDRLEHLYFGPKFSDDEIEKILDRCKLTYVKSTAIARDVAALLAKNAIVGWFQGAMEVGARALGGRSILANPIEPGARDHVNLHVKNRESWRPFCPSLKKEHFHKYFDTRMEDAPFMITACRVRDEYLEAIPSCIHVDGTVRPQTVDRQINPLYWELIDEFEVLTGEGILVNTSFNVQGEPIVMTPEHAIRCFHGSGMDALAIGNFIVTK
ncbi:MAG: hypothetical protein JJU31_08770 [Wenzhouxiangella sp.]|nr:hypothetical protein [Wenzhouxiangella sp.]MCH8479275.1 hypothetical protein [Wenzhouxiangella sp.]